MVSICCSPPDSVPAACFWRSRQNRKQVEQPVDLLGALAGRQMLAAEIEVLAHRHVGEQFAAFRDIARCRRARSPRPSAPRSDRALAADIAGIGHQPGDGVEQRRLAGAVEPDDGDEFAGVDVDRHVLQRLRLAVLDADLVDGEKRHCARGTRIPAAPRSRCCRRDRRAALFRSRITSSAVPSAMRSPTYMASTRSTRRATLFTLWSTSSTARPSSRNSQIRSENAAVSVAVRPANGSSISSTFGSRAIALAISILRRSANGSVPGRRSSTAPRPTRAAMARAPRVGPRVGEQPQSVCRAAARA